jgi:ABC-type multidrug transport system permease subunit
MYWGLDYVHFFLVYLTLVLIAQTAIGIGLFISSIAPNVTTATSIAPIFTMPMILFGGTFANTSTMPKWLSWIQWISPIRYANEALAHSQFDDVEVGPLQKNIPA